MQIIPTHDGTFANSLQPKTGFVKDYTPNIFDFKAIQFIEIIP
jgi:hypothetical protein